jgi:glycosyltransferase involved in cell wall biosynthesis
MDREKPRTIALMLESDGPGGAEIFLLQSAEELRSRGYSVYPVLPADKTGWLAEQFRDRGFSPGTFRIDGAVDWGCVRRLATDLEGAGVEVVHSHEFDMAVYGAAATRLLRKRHVITMHGNQTMTDALRRRIALRWAFWASEATVAVSEETRRHLIETIPVPEGRVQTIPNGIPDPAGDPAGPRAEFGLKEDEVVLVAAGNLTERKGHIVLLRALAVLLQQGIQVPWRLIIAGEGPERPKLEAFIEEASLGERVHLPGYRSDVGDLQAAADILVMPSLWEGLPLAILEGMYSGNAVVASRTSGIPEAVRDGVDGILCPPGEVDSLAAALRTLLEDPELLQRMGSSAEERARDRFSIERMMDDYERLYWGTS